MDATQTLKTELTKLDEQHILEVKAGRNRKPYFVWKDKYCYPIQFTRIHTSSIIKIEKTFDRPITKFYNSDDLNVIVSELG